MISRFTLMPRRSCDGFTYIGVLLAVAFIGVALAATGTVWQQTRQREKEHELLFVGNQFRQALEGYYENPPPGKAKKFPRKIEDLLQDDRYPGVRRYLRKIYRDPMTGGTEWGLLRGADKAIVGLYSLSDGEPLKTANFDPDDAALAGKRYYNEWQFIAAKGGVTQAPPSSSSESSPQAVTQQNQPVAESAQPLQQEPPPEAQESALCQAALMSARSGCMALSRKGGLAPTTECLRAASAQYAQCLK